MFLQIAMALVYETVSSVRAYFGRLSSNFLLLAIDSKLLLLNRFLLKNSLRFSPDVSCDLSFENCTDNCMGTNTTDPYAFRLFCVECTLSTPSGHKHCS